MSSAQVAFQTNSQTNSQMESGQITLPTFPMYDQLAEKLNQKVSQGNFSITTEYRTNLQRILSSCKPEQAEQIALLLIHYYFLNYGANENPFQTLGTILPLGIKISPSGQGFSFELDQLPTSFQALLGIYCGL